MAFVANFIRFPAVQKFWKSVEIWQSYREFKGGNFFEIQYRALYKCTYWVLIYMHGRNVAQMPGIMWLNCILVKSPCSMFGTASLHFLTYLTNVYDNF